MVKLTSETLDKLCVGQDWLLVFAVAFTTTTTTAGGEMRDKYVFEVSDV